MTQTSEFATRLGRNPGWWLLAAKKAMYYYAATFAATRDRDPAERAEILADAADTLQHRLDQLLDLAERSTSGE